MQVEYVGHACAPRLLGRGARGGAPLGDSTLGALADPTRDTVLGSPRHDHIDADLGHRRHGLLTAIALGQGLHDDKPG